MDSSPWARTADSGVILWWGEIQLLSQASSGCLPPFLVLSLFGTSCRDTWVWPGGTAGGHELHVSMSFQSLKGE